MRLPSARRGASLIAAALTAVITSAPAHAGSFEDQVLAEINRIRANPRALAAELRRAGLVQARYGYGEGPLGFEDPDAVEDAIGFLMRQPPLPPLARDGRLADAARVHVQRQGPSGQVGHGAAGALGRRLQAEGLWAGLSAENISYGQNGPREVVRQLVVDSGVPGRGHRKNLFSGAYQAAGVACGGHAQWGSMCVIDFAGAIVRR
jgi:hypothetical protein